jgi:hypothetical protein
LPAQFELELAQRFNDIRLEQRRGRGITFHLSIRESLELLDHFIKFSAARSGRAPFASQILGFTKPLTYLRRKLSRIARAIAATHHRIPVWSHTLAVAL